MKDIHFLAVKFRLSTKQPSSELRDLAPVVFSRRWARSKSTSSLDKWKKRSPLKKPESWHFWLKNTWAGHRQNDETLRLDTNFVGRQRGILNSFPECPISSHKCPDSTHSPLVIAGFFSRFSSRGGYLNIASDWRFTYNLTRCNA